MILFSVSFVGAYECYVCHEQKDNVEKCIKTVRKCELNENHCLTMVKWGSKLMNTCENTYLNKSQLSKIEHFFL